MLHFPPAKINLGLYITEKRLDGYHNLETVFYPLPDLHDVLEMVPAAAPEPAMHLSGLAVAGPQQNNLVWKAYELMQNRFPGVLPPLDWHLHKAIPMGAGLGGGSSDGAYALLLMNEQLGNRLSKKELLKMALQLGSDCPFFVYGKPCFASGRGEELSPIALSLSGYRIKVVPSSIHVSTAEAFGMLRPRPAPFNLRRLAEMPVAEWRNHISNDFEAPVFAKHPALQATKAALYGQGALYAQMSGSGSAVFGIFPEV